MGGSEGVAQQQGVALAFLLVTTMMMGLDI